MNRVTRGADVGVHTGMTRRFLLGALVALAGCRAPTGPGSFYGRWDKLEDSLPPVSLELRHGANGDEGQVWLSGRTFTLPATFRGDSVLLEDPRAFATPPLVGELQRDGTMRVRLSGNPPHETLLVRRNMRD